MGFAALIFLPSGGVMKGDNVSVYYTVTFENGTIIATNMNGTPLSFTVGSSDMIAGLSNAMVGMKTEPEENDNHSQRSGIWSIPE